MSDFTCPKCNSELFVAWPQEIKVRFSRTRDRKFNEGGVLVYSEKCGEFTTLFAEEYVPCCECKKPPTDDVPTWAFLDQKGIDGITCEKCYSLVNEDKSKEELKVILKEK